MKIGTEINETETKKKKKKNSPKRSVKVRAVFSTDKQNK